MSEMTSTVNGTKCLSDGESPLAKRQRRRRTRVRRFVPYTASSPEVDGEDGKTARRRSERLAKPMAPFNTTQFLLEDREARAEAEQDAEIEVKSRLRTVSDSSDLAASTTGADFDDGASCSGESYDQDADREFATKYLEVKRARINQMTKSELEEELLERSQDTETLQEACDKMQSENKLLKELLVKNGIDFADRSKSTSPST